MHAVNTAGGAGGCQLAPCFGGSVIACLLVSPAHGACDVRHFGLTAALWDLGELHTVRPKKQKAKKAQGGHALFFP